MIERLLYDVRRAVRQSVRAPAFSATVIATLALAIGANAAFFSLVNAIVLRKLPVRDPDRLLLLQASDDRGQNRPIYESAYRQLAHLPVFESLSLYSGGGLFQIDARGSRQEGLIEASTAGLFESLGLHPHLGRFFANGDVDLAAAVAVISHDFWVRAFDADPRAVGETILIEGRPVVVIGVTPPHYKGFYADGGFGFSVPLTFLIRELSVRPPPVRGLNAVGRLAPGVTLAQARAALDAAWPSIRADTRPIGLSAAELKAIATGGLRADSLATGFSALRRQYQDPLLLVSGIALVLLAIGCVNLSGLLLARASARDQQLTIAVALGASRGRIIQQLAVEGVLLSMTGAAVALPLAWWTTRAAGGLLWPSAQPMARSLAPDARVLALMAFVSVATGLLMSAFPAWSVARRWPTAGVRSHRSTTAGRRWGRWLLGAQVAMSLVLVVAAALFTSTLVRLRTLDAGFRTDNVRWARLFAVPDGYRNQNDAAYYPDLVRQLSEIPGVRSVAQSSIFPTFFGVKISPPTEVIARSESSATDERTIALVERISPRFFETTGMPLLRGRDFTWTDDTQHPPVAIINESLKRALFGGTEAIGRSIRIGDDPSRRAVEVVAVAGDASIASYRQPHAPAVFRPRMQELAQSRAPVTLFRIADGTSGVDAAATQILSRLGHEYARRFYGLDEQVQNALLSERLLAALSSFFAALAGVIACIGLYSAVAHAVSQRTREIGVRMALGASPGAVTLIFVGESLLVTVTGVAVGIPCAIAAGRLIASFIFGMTSSDPAILLAAGAAFLGIGCLAALVPARRAAHVDPVVSMRCE
jgi:putative ABC transport system permease protein